MPKVLVHEGLGHKCRQFGEFRIADECNLLNLLVELGDKLDVANKGGDALVSRKALRVDQQATDILVIGKIGLDRLTQRRDFRFR